MALPASPHAVSAASEHIAAALQGGPVSERVRADAVLLATGLVANVIRQKATRTIDIDLVLDGAGAVTITVTGARTDPPQSLLDTIRLASPASGPDLSLLDSLPSAWGTRHSAGRTSVWFTLSDSDFTTEQPIGTVGSSSADAVVNEAGAVVSAIAARLTAEPEVAAAQAAVTTEQAALDAATKAAGAARNARTARATAAISAAAAVAEAAANTVRVVQAQADDLAEVVASAARLAAATVSDSVPAGGHEQAARVAHELGVTVASAAMAKAEETAQAAILVARAVADAATAVAANTAAAAIAIDNEVLEAAKAVRAVTTATASELAADTIDRRAAAALASREATTLSNAVSQRLHEVNRQLTRAGQHDRFVALALQEAMLTRMPEPENLILASRYLTAAEEDQVGGDWYDAITLRGVTTLVIGDVIGHDIHAAAVMGQLRNVLRGLVLGRNHPPSNAVARLDQAIRDLHIDTIATLIVANIEPPEPHEPLSVATIRWSNAGHPAPVLISADGTAINLHNVTDRLLGVTPDYIRRDLSHPIAAGATLLLYTDGLIETRTDSIDEGQRRLLAAASAHHRLSPGDLLDAILADMVGGQPRDDVAVLAVRFQDSLNPIETTESQLGTTGDT